MTSINEKLVRHAVSRIRDAEVYSEPFPHLFFENFFPADIYAKILSSVPDDSVFRALNRENTRLTFALHNSSSKLDPKIRDLWQSVSAMLMSTELEQAIRKRLFEGLEIRRRAANLPSVDELPMYARPVIYKDLEGYRIVPHPDTRKKIVTMQIYCPPDVSLCDLGTTLYKLSLKGLLKPSSRFLEPAKTFPFVPNVGYAFVVLKPFHSLLKTSWHGRPPITMGASKLRLSISNTFYTSEARRKID